MADSKSSDRFEEKQQKLQEEMDQVDSRLQQVRHRISTEQDVLLSDPSEATELRVKKNIAILRDQELNLCNEKLGLQSQRKELELRTHDISLRDVQSQLGRVSESIKNEEAVLDSSDSELAIKSQKRINKLEIEKLELQLKLTEISIKKVESEIQYEEGRLLSRDPVLMEIAKDKLRYLRDKRKDLRDEEKDLRAEKRQLVAKQNPPSLSPAVLSPEADTIELDISPDENGLSSRKSFESLAEKLYKTDEIQAILKGIENIHSNYCNQKNLQHAVPFMFIEGSSGKGKTQSSFCIRLAAKRDFVISGYQTLYFPSVLPLDEIMQPIYHYYENLCESLRRCLERDFEKMGGDGRVAHFKGEKLFTFDFLQQLLKSMTSSKKRKLDSHDTNEKLKVKQAICPDSMMKQKIVVILDEFNVHGGADRRVQYLRFVRNLFRYLKWVVIVMGTDTTVANLVKQSTHSRTASVVWCFVYHKLPGFVVPAEYEEFYDTLSEKCAWVTEILQHSRPLLSISTLKLLKENNGNDSFQEILKSVATSLFDSKDIFSTEAGRYGQVALFLNMAFSENHSHFIHQHFANLVVSGNDSLYLFGKDSFSFGLSANEAADWMPESRFADVKDDVLLYLCLMGLPGIDAIRVSKTESVPFTRMAQKINSDSFRGGLDVGNSVQKVNSGEILEAFGVGAFIAASHAGGFQGVSLVEFLPQFVYHMDMPPLKMEGTTIPQVWDEIKVPFLAPPNQEWPASVYSIPNGFFGCIDRLRQAERIDARVYHNKEVLFGLEMKNYTHALDKKALGSIFKKISVSDPVVFIITNTMQNEYGFEKNELSSQQLDIWQTRCFWKIQATKDDHSTISVMKGFEDRTMLRPIICVCRTKI